MDPCVITCALSGVAASREQCPGIPYTPEEYAAESRRAYEAGASVVHIHARYADGQPSYRVEEYAAITEAILAEHRSSSSTTRPARSRFRWRSVCTT